MARPFGFSGTETSCAACADILCITLGITVLRETNRRVMSCSFSGEMLFCLPNDRSDPQGGSGEAEGVSQGQGEDEGERKGRIRKRKTRNGV